MPTRSSSFCIASLSVALVLAGSCKKKEIEDHGSSEVDFQSPKQIVASIFYAARTGEAKHLSSLCDPQGEGNRFVMRICGQEPGTGDWDEFASQFAKGKIIGEPRISGESAQVNFVFGPEGTSPETMELVRREGRWHLLRF